MAQATLQPGRNFSFAVQVLDLESHASVRAAVKALPKLDGVVLNAGGLLGEELTAHGVTQSFAANGSARALTARFATARASSTRRFAQPALRRLSALCAALGDRGVDRITPTRERSRRQLYDQSAFSSYYGDEELQAEATRPRRRGAMGMPIVVRRWSQCASGGEPVARLDRRVVALLVSHANGEDGEHDQSAFSSYYGDEELQAEATRVCGERGEVGPVLARSCACKFFEAVKSTLSGRRREARRSSTRDPSPTTARDPPGARAESEGRRRRAAAAEQRASAMRRCVRSD